MKRDMDFAREIMLAIEECERDCFDPNQFTDKHSVDEIWGHIRLLIDAGLVEGEQAGMFGYIVRDLTWEGHDFVDMAREDTKFNKAKSYIISTGSTITFETLKAVMSAFAKHALQLP